MFESLILGAIQGIAEWLPISSEAAIIFVKSTFFKTDLLIEDLVKGALFLHLGTFLSALIYFRREVLEILKNLIRPKKGTVENKKVLNFLIIATLLSGLFGLLILKSISQFEAQFKTGTGFVNAVMAVSLFVTAFLQLKTKRDGLKKESDLSLKDGILLGLAQGLAVIPGLSRSGLTVSALLLRRFDDTVSLRLSFLLSLPIVFFGNLILNISNIDFSLSSLWELMAAFLVGLLTIDLLLKLAKKINFGYFTLFFGFLVAIAAFF